MSRISMEDQTSAGSNCIVLVPLSEGFNRKSRAKSQAARVIIMYITECLSS